MTKTPHIAVLGWSMADHPRHDAVAAPATRTHRSCAVYLDRLRDTLSRARHATVHGSIGDAYDNALCEAFFATFEYEIIDRRFRSQAEARMAVFTFIEGWYNPRRRHSALGYLSPLEYERRTQLSA